MTDINSALARLRRPRLLVRAARHGLSEYNRKRDLTRISGQSGHKESNALVANLIEQEEQIESTRRAGDAAYSIARHIEVLVALMAECQLLPRNQRA